MIPILHHFGNGAVGKAERAWHRLRAEEGAQSTARWNVVMEQYVKRGHFNKSLLSMEEMRRSGVRCDGSTYCHALSACIGLKALEKGMEIHAEALSEGLLRRGNGDRNGNGNGNGNGHRHHDRGRAVQRALISMYSALWTSSSGKRTRSQYKAVMALLLSDGRSGRRDVDVEGESVPNSKSKSMPSPLSVFRLYLEAETEGVVDEEIAVYALRDCAERRALDSAKRVHRELMAMERASPCSALRVTTSNELMATYRRCGAPESGWRVFESLSRCRRGLRSYLEAVLLCGRWGGAEGAERGKRVHGELMADGLMAGSTEDGAEWLSSIAMRRALISLYSASGDVRTAERVWGGADGSGWGSMSSTHSLSDRLSVLSAMMRCCSNNKEDAKALDLYHEITRKEAVGAEHAAIHCDALMALGNLGSLDRGQTVFELVRRHCTAQCAQSQSDRVRMESAMIAFAFKCGVDGGGRSDAERLGVDLSALPMASWRGAMAIAATECGRGRGRGSGWREGAVRRLAAEFKLLFGAGFTAKEWRSVLSVAARCGNGGGGGSEGAAAAARAVMAEWRCLLASGQRIAGHLLVAVLQHLLRCGEAQFVADLWNDILLSMADGDGAAANGDGNGHRIELCSLSLQSLILCVDRSRWYHRSSLLLEMWNLAVQRLSVRPNVHCHCLAILAFSKSADARGREMAKELLLNLENDEEMRWSMATNPLSLIQALSSYANLGALDEMQSFYSQQVLRHNAGRHDLVALLLMASKESRPQKMQQILLTVDRHFEWNSSRRLTVDHLIGFHRVAIRAGHHSMAQRISSALRLRHQSNHGDPHSAKTNVASTVDLDAAGTLSIATGYGHDDGGGGHIGAGGPSLNDLVDALMADIEYTVDTAICPELHSESARRKHLKSHSEKKALALLLHRKETERKRPKKRKAADSTHRPPSPPPSSSSSWWTLTVRVDMRMCADCHSFFAAVSRKYSRYNIRCVDPKGIHLFKAGTCYLCD